MFKITKYGIMIQEILKTGDNVPKKKIQISIKNEENENIIETIAIVEEDTIKYLEEEKTTVIFYKKQNRLIRENDDLRMEYTFDKRKETPGKIHIKEYNKDLEVMIKTKRLEQKEELEIEFEVENNQFLYKIKVL